MGIIDLNWTSERPVRSGSLSLPGGRSGRDGVGHPAPRHRPRSRCRISWLISGWALFCPFLFLSVFSFPAEARPELSQSEGIVQAELVLETKDFSSPFTVGIRFELAPDWYLYWINPGDAGLPVEIRWILPEGLEAGPLIFPVPEKFVSGDIVAFGYKKEVVLLSRMTPRPTFEMTKNTALEAEVDWLVCKESCLRGLSRVKIIPSELKEDDLYRGRKLLSQARDSLPRSAEGLALSVTGVHLRHQGFQLEVKAELAGAGAASVIDFFPYPLDSGTLEHGRIRVNLGSLVIPLVLFDPRVRPDSLRGLLMVRSPEKGVEGYEFEIRLRAKEKKTS